MKNNIFYSTLFAMITVGFILSARANNSHEDYIEIGMAIGFTLGLFGVVFANYFLDGVYITENLNKNIELLESTEVIHDKYINKKREQQHQIILAVINAFDYEPLKIPTGGKSKIRDICLRRVRVFTISAFEHAWKDGTNAGLFRLLESDKFSSR